LFYDHPGRGFFQTSRVVVINRIVLLNIIVIVINIIIIIIIVSEHFREGQHSSREFCFLPSLPAFQKGCQRVV
jgi:hypothetical protein